MITVNGRILRITDAERNIGVVGDNKVETRQFEITDKRLFDLQFKLDLKSGEHVGIIDLEKTVEADRIILTWTVLKEHIPNARYVYAQLRAFNGSDLIWHSKQEVFKTSDGINATDYFPSPLPSEFEQIEQRVTAIQSDVIEKAAEVEADRAEVATNTATVLEKAEEALQSAAAALQSEINAKTSEDNAKGSETEALRAMGVAVQAMTDLLAMMGEDIATLTNGKLTPSQIPDISINDVFEVSEVSEMLALTAQRGDCALIIPDDVVTDSYILAADDPTVLANWKKLGVSYVANAGHAVTADNATNATKINGHRLVTMTEVQYEQAVLEESTLYAVYPDESEE